MYYNYQWWLKLHRGIKYRFWWNFKYSRISRPSSKTNIEIREGTTFNYNSEEVFNKELPIINNALNDGENCHSDETFKIINVNSKEEIAKSDDINNFEIKLSNPFLQLFAIFHLLTIKILILIVEVKINLK